MEEVEERPGATRTRGIRRVAVFDIDGTLTDTNAVDDECFLKAAGQVLGLELGATDWSQAPHVTDAALLEWLCERHRNRPMRADEIDSARRVFFDLLTNELARNPKRFRAIAGAEDVFPRLLALGWEVAVATGGWEASARLKLSAIGVDHVPLAMASSSDAHTRAEIVSLAVARLGSSAQGRVVSVGDGVWDVRAAVELEVPFVGVVTGARAEKLRAAGAQAILGDLRDTATLCSALESAKVPRRA